MSNDTQRILEMLSEGKITVEEAERLLEALGANGPTPTQAPDPIIETAAPEDDEQEAGGEGDKREPIGPGPGVKMGAGASVSPGVKFPPGSVIGMGAAIQEGVVVESAIKIGMGAVIGAGTKIGADVKIDMGAAIGERVTIGAGPKLGWERLSVTTRKCLPAATCPMAGTCQRVRSGKADIWEESWSDR